MDGSPSGRALDTDLPAVPESCPRARQAVRRALSGTAVDRAALELAVSEAVTNVVVHAYRRRDPGEAPGRIRLAVWVDRRDAWVVVADDGDGMRPRHDSPGLGLGLSLIAGLCQQLEIEECQGGTRLRMRFAL